MDEGSQPAEQGGGSHHSEDGGPLSAGFMVRWMREQPPLTEEQLQNVFITSTDFSVSVSMYVVWLSRSHVVLSPVLGVVVLFTPAELVRLGHSRSLPFF